MSNKDDTDAVLTIIRNSDTAMQPGHIQGMFARLYERRIHMTTLANILKRLHKSGAIIYETSDDDTRPRYRKA